MSPADAPQLAETATLIASITAAVVYGLIVRGPTRNVFRTSVKTASTFLLSFTVYLINGPQPLAGALALGSLGDAFLAWDDGDASFLAGLSSFLVAHLIYIWVFMQRGAGVALIQSEGWRMTLAILLAILVPPFGATIVSRVDYALRVPVGVYTTVILCMVYFALTNENVRVVQGAVLFAGSDAILATEKFLIPDSSRHRTWMPITLWALYYVGQTCIAMGVAWEG